MGFWSWLGLNVAGAFIASMKWGLWVIFPMIVHVVLLGEKAELSWTGLLWFIPFLLTVAYNWYNEEVKEGDC